MCNSNRGRTNFDVGIREAFEQESKRESDYQDRANRGVELSHIAASLFLIRPMIKKPRVFYICCYAEPGAI